MFDPARQNELATEAALAREVPRPAVVPPPLPGQTGAPAAIVEAKPAPKQGELPFGATATAVAEPLTATDVEDDAESSSSVAEVEDPEPEVQPARRFRFRAPLLDPGWLWLIAGLTIIGFTLILPAQRDLADARLYRDRVRAAEEHREQRLARYQGYLDALNREDESLILSLAAMQLNKAPKGTDLLVQGNDLSNRSASVFGALEPPPLVLPERVVPKHQSLLDKWTSDDRSRLWLLAGGSLAILIGLLPASRRREEPASDESATINMA